MLPTRAKVVRLAASTTSITRVSALSTSTSLSHPVISKELYAAVMGINLQEPPDPFSPCYMFFYGSLMDTEVLQTVVGLTNTPSVLRGSITGYKMKMWGIYPTIIPIGGPGKIFGTVWKVESEAYFERLKGYETGAYTWCFCDVELVDGRVLKDCRTFCWAGAKDSKELEEGTFDLLRYQKYFKASVVRK